MERSSNVDDRIHADLYDVDQEASAHDAPEHVVESQATVAALGVVVRSLPEGQRHYWLLRELSDYLASGRSPHDAPIKQSASCCSALEALERLSSLGLELVTDDDAADETLGQRIMGGTAAETPDPGALIGRCLLDGDVTDSSRKDT